jgi:signal transduction histidine kinase
MRILRNPRVLDVADVVLALALATATLVEMALADRDRWWVSSPWLLVPAALATTLPLARRRRHPIPVCATVVAGALALLVFMAPTEGSFSGFVALIVALYSLGAHTSDRRATWLVGAIAAAWIVGGTISVTAGDQHAGDVFPSLVWAVAAWGVGRIIRRNRLRNVELERLTAELRHEREERARLAVAAERTRIARELHDVISHNVSVIVIQAAAEERVLPVEAASTRDVLRSIESTGRETLTELRRLLGVLRRRGDDTGALAPQPGLDSLETLARQVSDAGLPVELRRDGEARPLPVGLDLSAYRIVQEALTNALKHARASHATVAVRYEHAALELEIIDDGSGDGQGGGTGTGLVGMRERASLYGGEIEAGRVDGRGFRVRARLPIAPA